mgnify:CR=1 FL=1
MIAFGCIVTHYKWTKWFVRTVKQHQPHCKVIVGNSVGSSIPDLLMEHTPVDVIVSGEEDVTIVELLRAIDQGHMLEAQVGDGKS